MIHCIKIPMVLFEELGKKILKLMCGHQRFVVKATLSREISTDLIPDFRSHYRAMVTSAAWHLRKTDVQSKGAQQGRKPAQHWAHSF